MPSPTSISLSDAVPGYAVRVPARGSAYKVITPAREVAGCGKALPATLSAAFDSPESLIQQRFHTRFGMTAALEDVLFFDLETTGLGQMPLFLIGAMTWEQGELVIRQFLAREYREEAAVIQLFLEMAAEKRFFITFNGRSFDLPYVHQRAAEHNIPSVLHAHHFDLLHESRRIWRKQLPDCKLQTLEQHICGQPPRDGDIPGSEIPAAYHAFVLSGNAHQLAQIMRHNQLDLVTMAELLTRLPPPE
ncbi:MAG: ribonuclease H-like domain-containing protein [Armatimonadota bacterium]